MGICYITGVPAVGKSTLCENLLRRFPEKYQHISFGQLILSALAMSGHPHVTEPDLRRETSKLATVSVLSKATELLYEQLAESTKQSVPWVLLDSHAVSQDWYGFIATPDGTSYFSRLRYSAIVHLYAEPATILSRSAPEVSGRRATTIADLQEHDSLLQPITVQYSALSQCPAYFVKAEDAPSMLAEKVNRVLESGAH